MSTNVDISYSFNAMNERKNEMQNCLMTIMLKLLHAAESAERIIMYVSISPVLNALNHNTVHVQNK